MRVQLTHISTALSSRTWEEARALLVAGGWQLYAEGDWAWVYRSPDASQVARLSPFDPAHRIFLRWMTKGGTPHFPRVAAVQDFDDGGYLALLEHLFPCPGDEANAFIDAIACDGMTGRQTAAIAATATLLREIVAECERALPFFGGIDANPANVMKDHRGNIVWIDPVNIAGKPFFDAILARHPRLYTYFNTDQLRLATCIPFLQRRENLARREEILRALAL